MKAEKKVEAPWDSDAGLELSDSEKAEILHEQRHRAKLQELRAPFDPRAIGKLPRASRADAKPGKCSECGGWHKLPAIHLDYVGHAEVTDRLLSVDPEWNWAPLALEQDGTPKFVRAAGGNPLGLWIKLTVLGVTRLGYGSVEGHAFDAEKQLIGDAIRNAAMRFGVALDLWSKAELESTLEPVDKATGEIAAPPSKPSEEARMQAEVDAFATTPAAPRRVIEGIPISTVKTWSQVKTLPLGGKGRFQTMTLERIIDQDMADDREALDYFEGTVVRAILSDWNKRAPAKKADGIGLTSECALIAYDELQTRRSSPPTFPTDEEK